MLIRGLVSRSVNLWLAAARTPITVAERVLGSNGDRPLPPAVTFDRLASQVKLTAALVLGDQELADEGRVLRAKVRKIDEAADLQAEAEAKRLEADAEYSEDRAEAQEHRREARERAEQRKRKVEEQTEKERERVRDKAEEREEAVEERSHIRQKAVTAQERAAERTRIEEEEKAYEARRRELAAKRARTDIDEAIEVTKARRKS